MSGIKDMNLTLFYRSLHARGMDVTALAKEIKCGRSHLSQVLSGTRSGKPTWRKLEAPGVLTDAELRLLGRNVPQETLSHVEQMADAAIGGGNLLGPLRDKIASLQQTGRQRLANFVEDADGMLVHEGAIRSLERLEYLAPAARDLRSEALRAEMCRDGYDTWHYKTRRKFVADLYAMAAVFDQLATAVTDLRAREAEEITQLCRTA